MDDIDDLFTAPLNDGLPDTLNGHLDTQLVDTLNSQLDIPTNIVPPVGLIERLEELHAGGCNQTIAWSKLGALACINVDRKSVSIKCLQFQKDGNWHLSEDTDSTLNDKLVKFHIGYDLVHVAWSPSAYDLLVIDSSGRILIGFVWTCLNRILVQRAQNIEPEDNLNTVVALKWLTHTRKPIAVAGTAIKENGRWRYPLSPADPRGPFSPNQKVGFLIVTRGCMVKLFLQGNIPTDWSEVRYELDGLSSSSEIITHASMCSEKTHPKKDDEILLAVHTTARRLRLYTIRIDWQQNQDSISTSIHVQHVIQLDSCSPSLATSSLSNAIGLPTGDPELCSLTMLPRITIPGYNESTTPIVLAAFSHTNITGSITTILSRWEVLDSSTTIDPTFAQLSTKKSSSARLPDERALLAWDDIPLDHLVINIELIHHDTTIALCYSNGEVDIRDRNLAIPLPADSTDRAPTPSRLGFIFDNSQPCLETALSPHSTAKASRNKSHECTLSTMHLVLPISDAEVVSQVAASFVLQHVEADPSGNLPTDDLLMTMWEFQHQLPDDQRKTMTNQFLRDLYQVLQVTDKIADDNMESLIKFPALGKCASVQSSLGIVPLGDGYLSWTRAGKIGFSVQSLRIIALSLAFAAVTNKSEGSDLARPEVLDYISPQVKWFITLVDYICDQLFHINRVMGTKDPFNGQAVATKIESSYACLILILCSATRKYLRYVIKAMKMLPALLSAGMAQAKPAQMLKYNILSSAFRSGILLPSQLDTILDFTDRVLHPFYSQIRPGERAEIEMTLLAEAMIPAALFPMIQKILTHSVEQVRVDTGDLEEVLAFKDWGPVSLVDDKQTRKWERETDWDATRKVELTGKSVKKRICLRCTGQMEEPSEKKAPRHWQSQLTKTCFCGGHWITAPISNQA